MLKEIRTIHPDTLAQEAAATLNKFKINSVIVFQKERSVDIIIVREVLNRLVEKSAAPRMLIARYAMTTPFTTINKGPTMDEAGKSLGKTNVKTTSVMEKDNLVGNCFSQIQVSNSKVAFTARKSPLT